LPISADTCVGDVGCPGLSHVAGEVGAHVTEGVERPHRELYSTHGCYLLLTGTLSDRNVVFLRILTYIYTLLQMFVTLQSFSCTVSH
jgi:hypothetical protein